MFQFPDGVYTDVRVEDVFESKIQITLKNLENMKQQSYKAAFIRVFDGGRWYYAATTSSDNVQGEIDRLATMATKNHNIADHPGIACLEVNQGEYFRFNDTKSVRNISKNDKLKDLKIYEVWINSELVGVK
jgi:TldD protein